MNRTHIGSIAALIAGSLTISGCGGGGDIAPVASPDPSIVITSSNAVEVSKLAYEAALGSQQLSSVGGSGIGVITGSAPSGFMKAAYSSAPVPIPAETTPCAVSGSTTISGDIADIVTPTITAGDFILIEFDVCDDGFDVITDGSVRTAFDAFSGDLFTGLFSMTSTMTLTDFEISLFDGQSTIPVDVISTNGAATLTVDTTNSPFISSSTSGNSLVVDSNSSSESLTNFSSTSTVDGNQVPAPFTSSASGTLDSTELSGIISYSNPVQFAGLGLDYPSSGEFLVRGSNSSLRLIAVDNINVRIEIDMGDDGTVDETINTTWMELTAS